MSQTAAERATAFAIEKFKAHEALKAEATRIYAEYEEAKGEFQWAMAHPALPEGFDPSAALASLPQKEGEETAPAPKRRGRPRKAAEAKPETPPVQVNGTVSETGGLPVGTAAAPAQPGAEVAPGVTVAPAPAPVAPQQAAPQQAPVGDFFDPFAGN